MYVNYRTLYTIVVTDDSRHGTENEAVEKPIQTKYIILQIKRQKARWTRKKLSDRRPLDRLLPARQTIDIIDLGFAQLLSLGKILLAQRSTFNASRVQQSFHVAVAGSAVKWFTRQFVIGDREEGEKKLSILHSVSPLHK